jgi:hypothetical protein
MSNQSKAVFKHAVALVFLFTHAVSYAGAPASEATCNAAFGKVTKEIKACKSAITAAQANTGKSDGTLKNGAETLGVTAATGKAITAEGKAQCGKVFDACKDACAGTTNETKCNEYGQASKEMAAGEVQNADTQQSAMDTQSAASGQSGSGDMMGMLMGAGIGGLLGYMMAKKMNEDKKEDEPTPDPDSALLPTGQLDCSKGDAYMYGECNAWLEANCAGSTTPACTKFSNRYCGSDPAQVKASGGFVGEGLGTAFCKNVAATNFCKVQGRSMCPSCLGLARNNSAACQQDPSLCLAQNSPEQINEAKKTCPTDPAFSDPNYVAGGGSQVPDTINNGSLPAVVLPQSVAGVKPASVSGGAAVIDAKSSSGYSTASVAGASGAGTGASAGGAIREGEAAGAVAGSNGSAGTYAAGAAVSGVARDVASAKSGVNYRTASAEGRPSDVEGPFGPSLFKTSTEVIKSRCDAGKLNNCP